MQELIAPQRLEFYNESWEKIAEKTAVAKELAVITGIDAFVLDGSGPLQQVSVGRCLSWAANRETTRKEDVAYCLFGLFDVYMPLMYGEGGRAFFDYRNIFFNILMITLSSPGEPQLLRQIQI